MPDNVRRTYRLVQLLPPARDVPCRSMSQLERRYRGVPLQDDTTIYVRFTRNIDEGKLYRRRLETRLAWRKLWRQPANVMSSAAVSEQNKFDLIHTCIARRHRRQINKWINKDASTQLISTELRWLPVQRWTEFVLAILNTPRHCTSVSSRTIASQPHWLCLKQTHLVSRLSVVRGDWTTIVSLCCICAVLFTFWVVFRLCSFLYCFVCHYQSVIACKGRLRNDNDLKFWTTNFSATRLKTWVTDIGL